MYDMTALGELLIDFTPYGKSETNQKLYEQNPGGAPVNVLATISNFNMKTAFIGKVGYDIHGTFLKEILKSKNIETKGLIMDDSVFTTLAFVDINQDGERNFSFSRKPGADTMLRKDEVDTTLIKNSKFFHVGSLSLTNEPSRQATIYALETARSAGCTISYDPNYRALLWSNLESAKKEMQSIIPYADVMKLSDVETDLLTPYKEPDKAAQYLINCGVSIVAVTLGSKGAYMQTKEDGIIVSGFNSNVIDTTGAGDSFWGGFIYQLLINNISIPSITMNQIKEYTKFANATASLCVEKRGCIPSLPTIDMIQKRISSSI